MVAQLVTPWRMYFDGAAKSTGAGIGIVFISPQDDLLPYSFHLSRNCTNNAAEYEALIMGLELALGFNIDRLDIYGDSELVIKQITTEYEVRNSNPAAYYDVVRRLMECFTDIRVSHVPRRENALADALANLATALAASGGQEITVRVEERSLIPGLDLDPDDKSETVESLIVSCLEVHTDDWRQPFIDYLRYGQLPDDPQLRDQVRRRAAKANTT